MNNKSIKWASLLLHYYEDKEYKEINNLSTPKELAAINILANIINNENLMEKKTKDASLKLINTFSISGVEKKAFFKIIKTPFPLSFIEENTKNISTESKQEIYLSIADIFITKNKFTKHEASFLRTVGDKLKINSAIQKTLITKSRNTYFKLANFLKKPSSKIKINNIFKNLILKQYKKIYMHDDINSNKAAIMSSIIFISALFNLKLNTLRHIVLLWTPIILGKRDPENTIKLISDLITIYKRYEKIIDWNKVNLKNITSGMNSKQTQTSTYKDVEESSINFLNNILGHVFNKNEHTKISAFQRTIRN